MINRGPLGIPPFPTYPLIGGTGGGADLSDADPADTANAATPGVSTEASRDDHVHELGDHDHSASGGEGGAISYNDLTDTPAVGAADSVKYTGGDITVPTGGFAELNTGLRITMDAAVGDLLEVGINGLCIPGVASSYAFDIATLDGGGAIVNRFAGGSDGSAAWLSDVTVAATHELAGSLWYVVQSGDLVAGQVTVSIVGNRVSGAAAGTVKATSTDPLFIGARVGTGGSGGGGAALIKLGYDAIGASQENVTNWRVYLKQITVTQTGLLGSIGAYVGQTTDNVFNAQVAVFSDTAGAPDKLLAMSNAAQANADNGHGFVMETAATPTYAAGWVHFPLGFGLEPGDYWIAIQFGVPTGTLQLSYDTGTDRYADAGGQWISHYGRLSSPTTSAREYSIRADFMRVETGGGFDTIIVQDQKTQNTSGGTFTSGADRTRDLNTEVVDTGNHCALSANQFTLAAGTYEIEASAPAYNADRHRAWLYNTSDSAVEVLGTAEFVSGVAVQTRSVIQGRFTIATSKTFEIRHRCQTTSATFGFGVESNLAGVEIYTTVKLTKVA